MRYSKIQLNVGVIVILIGFFTYLSCAYYNTFYNTKKAFEDGERALKNKLENEISGGDLQKFDLCLQKGSRVLEMYPGSKYVDDTLFLMGKSFFYKKDFVEAIRKFEELQTVFPQSEYIPEANLWWGKALVRLESYVDATIKLQELANNTEIKKKIRNEALLELAGMSMRQGNFTEAVTAFKELGSVIEDKEVLARVWLQMGFADYQIKEYSGASENFMRVLEYKPSEKEKYQAQYYAGVSNKLANKFDVAAGIFDKLLSDGKNSDHFAEIRLEITDCLTRQGKVDEALSGFKDIAEFYPNTIASTRAWGYIGKIYYDNMKDYPRAKAAFDSAMKGVRDTVTSDEIAPLSNYLIALNDYNIRIDSVKVKLKRQAKEDRSRKEPVTGDSLKFQVNGKDSTRLSREKERAEIDVDAKYFYLAGELFMYKIGVPDSSELYFKYIVETFPKSSYAPRSLLLLARLFKDQKTDSMKAQEYLQRIIKEYPDDEFVNIARQELGLKPVSLLQDSLRNLFMAAESLFFNVQDYDKALKYYSILCDSFPYSEFAPQCRFIIGWFYENALIDRENALREYQKLVDDYPQSLYAREVEQKLIAAKNPPPKLKEKDKDSKKRTLKRRRLFNEDQVKQ